MLNACYIVWSFGTEYARPLPQLVRRKSWPRVCAQRSHDGFAGLADCLLYTQYSETTPYTPICEFMWAFFFPCLAVCNFM